MTTIELASLIYLPLFDVATALLIIFVTFGTFQDEFFCSCVHIRWQHLMIKTLGREKTWKTKTVNLQLNTLVFPSRFRQFFHPLNRRACFWLCCCDWAGGFSIFNRWLCDVEHNLTVGWEIYSRSVPSRTWLLTGWEIRIFSFCYFWGKPQKKKNKVLGRTLSQAIIGETSYVVLVLLRLL